MKKRFLAAIAAVLLLGSGFSVSYMKDSDHAENSFFFIGEKGLDAVLSEPSWNPEHAEQILPSDVIPKDPCVTNTSEANLDELAALRIEFVYSMHHPAEAKRGQVVTQEDMDCIANVFQIDYNSDDQGDWVRFADEDSGSPVQHFYYKDVLKRNFPAEGDTTVPLFTRVTADRFCGNDRFLRIQNIGGFDIRISGCVLQYMEGDKHFGLNSAKEAWKAGRFVFDDEEEGR